MKRRLLAFLMTALWVPQVVLAGFSPGLRRLNSRLLSGAGVRLTLGARLAHLEDVSALTLEALQQLLPQAQLDLAFTGAGQEEAAQGALALDGRPLLDYQARQGPDGSAVVINGQGFAAPAGQEPLEGLLTGGLAWPPLPGARAGQALSGALPGLFEGLAEGKNLSQRRVIKNVGTAARQTRWQLTQEEWTAHWPAFLQALVEGALSPGPAAGRLQGWLQQAAFEGPADLRLYTSREGAPLGWQFTGSLSAPGCSARRVTLLTGWQGEAGLYISLKAPALEGRDSLTLQLSLREKARKDGRALEGDAAWSWRTGPVRDAGKARLALSSKDTPQGEVLSGTFTLDQPAVSGRPRRVLRLAPDLSWQGDALTGTVAVTRREGTRETLNLTVDISLASAFLIPPPLAQDVLAAHSAGETHAQAQARLTQALVEPWRQLLMTLPQDTRLALIHDMGRTARTQGDPVPPLPPTPSESVNEEDTP